MFDRITIDAPVCHGEACVRRMSFDEILAAYPDLEREDIQQALEHAAQHELR